MDLEFIHKLIGIVSRSPIDELEIERDGVRVRIAKPAVEGQARPQVETAAHSNPVVATARMNERSTVSAASRHSIRAPLTGVFYRSTSEAEPPLVSVGDVVEEGQKIGVLEAMKTFNVVEADRAGTVVQIAFEDHAAVQSGDVLFVLEGAG